MKKTSDQQNEQIEALYNFALSLQGEAIDTKPGPDSVENVATILLATAGFVIGAVYGSAISQEQFNEALEQSIDMLQINANSARRWRLKELGLN